MGIEFLVISSIVYIFLMALVWRIRGTGYLRKVLRLALVGIVTMLPLLLLFFTMVWWKALAIYAACVVVFAIQDAHGHGDYIDFGSSDRSDPDEIFNPIIRFVLKLFGKGHITDGYLHDSIGMYISGFYNFILASIIMALFITPFALLIPFLTGLAKMLGYIIGWSFNFPSVKFLLVPTGFATEWGELLRGPFYGAIFIGFAVLFLV